MEEPKTESTASCAVALPPAACSGSLHSCGGNGQFSLPCVLEGEAAEQRQLSFASTLMFSRETEY